MVMVSDSTNYSLFFRFIETFSPVGFKSINPDDPLIIELEAMTEYNNQFFLIADLIRMNILFTSKRINQMIGVEPAELTLYHFYEATHPDDIHRHHLGRAKLFKLAQNLNVAEKGNVLLSSNFKFRNAVGLYTNILFQCYIFYSHIPYKTVFLLQIHTDISWFRKIKRGFHYYLGTDLSFFRYPDEEMLMKGNIFSDREFEIIKLIHLGFTSEQIAEKIFLSVHTVETHRSNILKKSGKTRISDLIYYLEEQGLL